MEQSLPDLKSHADHFWKHLNELAESDPEEYKKFIQSQLQDGMKEIEKEKNEKRSQAPAIQPESGFAVRTALKQTTDTHPSKIYINICHSTQVLRPVTSEGRLAVTDEDMNAAFIPISIYKVKTVKSMSGADCVIYDAVVHTAVFDRAARESRFKSFLIETCLKRVEKRFTCSFSRQLKCLVNKRYKGGSRPGTHHVEEDADPAIFEQRKQAREKAAIPPPVKISANASDSNQDGISNIRLPGEAPPVSKVLIQELSSREHSISEGLAPQYSISMHQDRLTVAVLLPLIESAADVELDISPEHLKLSVTDIYSLSLPLPHPVDPNLSRAKWMKNKKTLCITIPLTRK
eukprot:GILK01005690.1.p1 GENE.GILK01005690.1~~GILK01005690.1.p1  ORF type:complete len:360 (+),score=68.12 GILK01005690.1:42-1082(+)